VDRPDDALAALKDFEAQHGAERDLMGRVLRARIVAYEATGRLKEAQDAVPAFIASAPAEAGPTLQSLFEAAQNEIAQLRRQGRDDDARTKSRGAVLFAEQLFNWGAQRQPPLPETDMYVLRLQWAEALRAAGQTAEALPMFRECAALDAKRQPDGVPHDRRVLLGLGHALAESGQFKDALPLFNRAFSESPGDSPERFEALLGDLTCRTELGEEPGAIVNVIKQHRFLAPEMGGPQNKEAFAALQQRNETRQRQGPAASTKP
jgi:tetratricopeptide (TPR) repeat protein